MCVCVCVCVYTYDVTICRRRREHVSTAFLKLWIVNGIFFETLEELYVDPTVTVTLSPFFSSHSFIFFFFPLFLFCILLSYLSRSFILL